MNDIDQLYRKTKGQLFYGKGAGFLGPLICNLEFEWDKEIDTACTNGLIIKWNPEWFMSLSPEMRVTVLAHEAYHVGMLHSVRRGSRDPQKWNAACDYVVNDILKKDGYIFNIDHLHEPKYSGMTTEQIYDILDKLYPNMPMPKYCGISGAGGDIKEKSSEDGNGGEDLTEAEVAQIYHNALNAKTSAQMTGNPGSVPGELTQVLEDYLRPVLPWPVILNNFFSNLCEDDYSYQRPNRRYQDPDPMMPGKIGFNGLEHLIYFLDISGSISDHQIKRFNSEVKHIKETYNPEKLTLVTFDTGIRNEYVFEKEDSFKKLVITGRGGTRLEPVVKYANEHKPTAVIIFSDLEVRIPDEKIKCPVVWICIDNVRKKVPYGKLIHLTEGK